MLERVFLSSCLNNLKLQNQAVESEQFSDKAIIRIHENAFITLIRDVWYSSSDLIIDNINERGWRQAVCMQLVQELIETR